MSEPARRLGVVHLPDWPPEGLPAFARQAEAAGYDELWLFEDCFLTGGFATAAMALASTERIAVGVGLLPAAVRNPAIAAMEIATLARVYPGRFLPVFGHGVDAWMRQIGARPRDRLAALEEVVGAVRALLAGEEVTMGGTFVTLDGVRLDAPPEVPPPVLVGTTGPRGLGIVARSADGVVVPEGTVPPAVRWARETAGGKATIAYAWLSPDLAALRPRVRAWHEAGHYPQLYARAGLDDGGVLDEDTLGVLGVAGGPEECAAAVRARWDAGADSVVLVAEAPGEYDGFAARVAPLLRT